MHCLLGIFHLKYFLHFNIFYSFRVLSTLKNCNISLHRQKYIKSYPESEYVAVSEGFYNYEEIWEIFPTELNLRRMPIPYPILCMPIPNPTFCMLIPYPILLCNFLLCKLFRFRQYFARIWGNVESDFLPARYFSYLNRCGTQQNIDTCDIS